MLSQSLKNKPFLSINQIQYKSNSFGAGFIRCHLQAVTISEASKLPAEQLDWRTHTDRQGQGNSFSLSPAPLCMSSVASAPTGHSLSISTTRPCPAAATGCWFTSRIRSPSISPSAPCEPGSRTCTTATWLHQSTWHAPIKFRAPSNFIDRKLTLFIIANKNTNVRVECMHKLFLLYRAVILNSTENAPSKTVLYFWSLYYILKYFNCSISIENFLIEGSEHQDTEETCGAIILLYRQLLKIKKLIEHETNVYLDDL